MLNRALEGPDRHEPDRQRGEDPDDVVRLHTPTLTREPPVSRSRCRRVSTLCGYSVDTLCIISGVSSPDRVEAADQDTYDPLVEIRLRLPRGLTNSLDEWAVRRKVSRNTIIRMILAANVEQQRP